MKTLCIILIFASIQISAQELKEIKSTFENFDQINDLKVLSESQVAILARAVNNNNTFTVLTRFTNGNLANNARTFNSQGMNSFSSIVQTSSGDLILSGRAALTSTGSQEPTLVRLTSEGTILWTSSFESQGGFARDVVELENGQLTGIAFNVPFFQSGFFTTNSDGSLVEQKELIIDEEPALIMYHHYLGNDQSIYSGVVADQSTSQLLPFVAKMVSGSIEWCKTYNNGFVLSETNGPAVLMEVSNDGDIYLGTTHSSLLNPSGNEVVLTKLESDGSVSWSKVSEPNTIGVMGLVLESLNSGGVWFGFVSLAIEVGEEVDMVLSRWDGDGQSTDFLVSNSNGRLLTHMGERADQTLVMAGVNSLQEDSYLVEVSANGELPCDSESWEGNFTDNTFAVVDRSTEITSLTPSFIEGEVTSIVVPVEVEELCSIALDTENHDAPSFKLYPNPSSDVISIDFSSSGLHHITLSDIMGRVIFQTNYRGEMATLDISHHAPGIYFVTADGRTAKLLRE